MKMRMRILSEDERKERSAPVVMMCHPHDHRIVFAAVAQYWDEHKGAFADCEAVGVPEYYTRLAPGI